MGDNLFLKQRLLLDDVDIRTIQEAVITVAGCGGVGTWAIELLARNGFRDFRLYDHDYFEAKNSFQLHCVSDTVGLSKVEVLHKRIQQINPSASVISNSEGVTPENVQTACQGASIICALTDNIAIQLLLYVEAVRNNIPIVHAGRATWPNRHLFTSSCLDFRQHDGTEPCASLFGITPETWGFPDIEELDEFIAHAWKRSVNGDLVQQLHANRSNYKNRTTLDFLNSDDLSFLSKKPADVTIDTVAKQEEPPWGMSISPEVSACEGSLVSTMVKDLILDRPKKQFFIDLYNGKAHATTLDAPNLQSRRKVSSSVIDEAIATIKSQSLFRYGGSATEILAARRLEARFEEYFGMKHCIVVNSCTSAIILGLMALGLETGEKVLIPAFTFLAVPSAVHFAGGLPSLVACDDALTICTEDLERKAQLGARFLVLSHMRGRVGDMDRIRQICKSYNVIVIEDCAHSLGVSWRGRLTGTFGKVSCLSFQSSKLLDAGEGGAVLTNSQSVARRILQLSGCYEKNFVHHQSIELDSCTAFNTKPMFNMRMSNVTAAFLLPQIDEIEDRCAYFRSKYGIVNQELQSSPYISIPRFHKWSSPVPDSVQFLLRAPTKRVLTALRSVNWPMEIDFKMIGVDPANARAFWRWQFIDEPCGLNDTYESLRRLCDFRIPFGMTNFQAKELGVSIRDAIEGAFVT